MSVARLGAIQDSGERPLRSALSTSVGRKAVMATTGTVLFVFVVGHLLGNLQVYLGRETFNAYAAALRHVPALLWTARLILLAAVATHVWMAVTLTLANWRARPVGYRRFRDTSATFTSRTMKWTGPLIGAYVVYHLLHLTLGWVHPAFVPGDVYHNVITAFRIPGVTLVYCLAIGCLGLHLCHGLFSALQTLGASHPRFNSLRRMVAAVIATLIVGGYLSIPLAVWTGVLP